MPYIDPKLRPKFEFPISEIVKRIDTAGELNYALTKICVHYLAKEEISYTVLNEILGAMEASKQEFYRRIVVPYEEKKQSQNGDVYNITPALAKPTKKSSPS